MRSLKKKVNAFLKQDQLELKLVKGADITKAKLKHLIESFSSGVKANSARKVRFLDLPGLMTFKNISELNKLLDEQA